MKFSNRIKIELFILLIVLNLILRNHPANHVMGIDSLEINILANSLNEFSMARWWVHPLSVIGMYPNSYASTMPFLLSDISQLTNVDNELAIFIYSIIFGIFSIFTSYLLAGMFYSNYFYKFIVAFGFSLSQGILTYSTWTGNARSPFLILFPLFLYSLMKLRKYNFRVGLIAIILLLLLLSTHHLVFYVIPIIGAYIIISLIYPAKKYLYNVDISNKTTSLILMSIFLLLFAFPFFTGKFTLQGSRYDNIPIMLNEYPRYIGIFIFLSVPGFFYLISKRNKRFEEWILLVMMMFLTIFSYDTMYMKWFVIIFAMMLAGVAFLNLYELNNQKGKYISYFIIILLISSCLFSGFFQYIYEYNNKRYIENDVYIPSIWMKENVYGRSISNDRVMSWEISAISGLPFHTLSAVNDQVYGFVDASEYELTKHSILSEKFWKDMPYVRTKGETSDGYWHIIMKREYRDKYGSNLRHRFNISFLVENTKLNGKWKSHHGSSSSNFILSVPNENNCIYNNGNINIWELS